MAPLQNTKEEFERQLREGHYNELRVALYFMLQDCLVRIGFRDGRYDIEVRTPDAAHFHVEVKWDMRAAKSGNLYFEVENTRQQRPSGIRATSADKWCHVVGDGAQALLVDVRQLRAFLDKSHFRSVRSGGDDSNSRGLLVPKTELKPPEFTWIELPMPEAFFGRVFDRASHRPAELA